MSDWRIYYTWAIFVLAVLGFILAAVIVLHGMGL
jgi:hypothetical protein